MDVANSLNISNTSVQTGQNAAQNAPVRKNEGSLFKNQPAGTPSEQTVSNALDNVGKLVARVLDDLKSASSLSKAEQILSQAKDTKIAPNLASELSDLAKSLESEAAQNESPEIKSLALKLKEFLKPIADLKAGSLNDQIKNSGVMLEANLKDALTPEKLPSSIQKLLSDIKNLSNQNLLSQILTLNDESLDNQNSFMKLTSMFEKASGDAKNILDNSSVKTLLKDVDKLDIKKLDKTMEFLDMDLKMSQRYVNDGFSGGEKKRNEILQMMMLEPKFAILDEIDSGLDIDALKVVSKGVNKMRGENFGCLIITHYQRLLDYIEPDFVHVLMDGKIVKSGGPELALRLEKEGYDWLKEEV